VRGVVALTIGMATYDDYDGVYFTIQALRLYQDLTNTEILVVDNFGCDETEKFVRSVPNARYLRATEVVGTAVRDLVFRHARGDAVLCVDSHILFPPGTIARLRDYYATHPETWDLLQGPLLYDDLRSVATHFNPVWNDQMWGTWGTDPRGSDPDGEAFDIPSQGLGVFTCRREAWPGFNPAFRGFGGEEGYIHEKFRQRGGRTLCLPWLRWVHRFGRPKGVPYPLTVEMKLRNYIIGFTELGLDTTEAERHFAEFLTPRRVQKVKAKALRDYVRYNLPLVSCICVTSGRPPGEQSVLEESIKSFLLQDYPNKELIVLNDCPGQELICEAPGVRVVNVPERIPSESDRLEFALALASGDLIAFWDDDSISLPWRLSVSCHLLGNADYVSMPHAWHLEEGRIASCGRSDAGHPSASLFRWEALHRIEGLAPFAGQGVQSLDAALRAALDEQCGGASGPTALPMHDWFLVHRADHSGSRPSSRNVENDMLDVQCMPGLFVLKPQWRADYLAKVEEALRDRVCVAVLGDGGPGRGQRLPFARLDQRVGETSEQHLARVQAQVAESIEAGATHLLIPRADVDWLADHPHLETYFAQVHDFTDAGDDAGLVFALRMPPPNHS
jgi:glycosyltransferase involved in cell wall biosynthesis